MQFSSWLSPIFFFASIAAKADPETEANLATVSKPAEYPNLLGWRFPKIISCKLQGKDLKSLVSRDFYSYQLLRWIQDSASDVACAKVGSATESCTLTIKPAILKGDPAVGWRNLYFSYDHTTVPAGRTTKAGDKFEFQNGYIMKVRWPE